MSFASIADSIPAAISAVPTDASFGCMTQPASVLRKMRTLSVDAEIVALASGGASGHATVRSGAMWESSSPSTVSFAAWLPAARAMSFPVLGQATRSFMMFARKMAPRALVNAVLSVSSFSSITPSRLVSARSTTIEVFSAGPGAGVSPSLPLQPTATKPDKNPKTESRMWAIGLRCGDLLVKSTRRWSAPSLHVRFQPST